MKDMIKQIVEADAKAKALDEEQNSEKQRLSREIDAEAEKIYNSYIEKAQKTVERNDFYEKKNAQTKWEEIQKKHKSISIKLQADFKANAEKWSDEIVKRTIEL